MSTEQNADAFVASFLDTAFEEIAQKLDRIADDHRLTSTEMDRIIGQWGDFKGYYSDWIRETWEPAPVGGGGDDEA